MLDPDNLVEIIELDNLKKLPEEYWIDIIRAALVLRGFGCKDIYVFGSVSRGQIAENSDLDLAIAGCPKGIFLKMYGKVMNITGHRIDLINLDKEQDKFVKYLKSRNKHELIRINKRGSTDRRALSKIQFFSF